MTDGRSSSSLADESIRRYAATVVELGDPPIEVDLRQPVSDSLRAEIVRAAGAGRFTIITAANPNGSVRSAEENRDADVRLRERLAEEGLSFVPGTGRDPDGPHREPGHAVAGDLRPVLALAVAFEQEAVFHFDGRRFLLVESRTGEAHALPLAEG